MKLPESFVKRFGDLFPNDIDDFIKSLELASPTSIRVNRNKISYTSDQCVAWCNSGYYLKKRPSFVFDPLFHSGCYYVQEASSMFLEQMIRKHVQNDSIVLDLCAAPGGKTTLALSNLSEGSFVVANEIVRSRAHVLGENLAKTGLNNYVVLNTDAAKLGQLKDCFDVVIADVPCSGEGMFRKDEESISEWSKDNVMMCAQRQKNILKDIWPALKPNGILIYSTCTYNREENEDQISWICNELGADSISDDILFEGITPSLVSGVHAYRFFPHKVKGEGFFISALRKHDEGANQPSYSSKNKRNNRTNVKVPESCKFWLNNPDDYLFQINDNEVYATPKRHADLLDRISRLIQPLYQALHVVTIKGKDLIPSHELALSTSLSAEAFPRYELTYQEAVSYLKKEAPTVSDECPKGFVLVTYNDIPLGFIKNIGNRTNNLYPTEWRIRTLQSPTASWTVLCDQQL